MIPRAPASLALVLAAAIAACVGGATPAAAQPGGDPLPLKPSLDDGASGAVAPTPEELPAEGEGPNPEPAFDGTRPSPGPQAVDPRQPPGQPPEAPESDASQDGAAALPPEAPPEASRPLRFGVIAGRDLAATMLRIEPVAADLGRILGRSVELLPMSSYGAMIDAQVQQRIDGGFYSASAFAAAEAQCRCLEPIVAPAAYDGTAAFHAVILAPRNSPIGAAADLEGKVVAAGAADSVGNRRMQLAGLLSEGIDPGRFAAFRDVDSGADGVRLMLSGGADAAFAWSSLAGDQEAGYSRGTLADLVAGGEIDMGDVAIVWRSPAIPHGPMAVLKTLPDADKGRIESYLLSLEADNPTAYDALNPYLSGGYKPVEPSDYQPLDILAKEEIDDLMVPSTTPGDTSGDTEAATDPAERADQR